MSKLLLFSHSGFSDENANGITMKNLLSAWNSSEKAEFFCDVEPPDFTAADSYFRVTDMQMLAAFAGKRPNPVFRAADTEAVKPAFKQDPMKKSPARIPAWLKKRKYNFGLKWIREILWQISPWGHRKLDQWIDDLDPDVIVYMVGESIFMDHLVLRTLKRTSAKLVLYNGEAYRIINIKERRGIERVYYCKTGKLYQKLSQRAALIIYNCMPLMKGYLEVFNSKSRQVLAYNSASAACSKYCPHSPLTISYFGNLGVGRVDSLLQVADVLHRIDSNLILDIYGNAADEDKEKFAQHSNIRYHGFVSADMLQEIMERSDILVHVESFSPESISKLQYAFSTKLAQYLCAGRPILCYAPEGSTSAEYLKQENGAVVAANLTELESGLERLIMEPEVRIQYARHAEQLGMKNHDRETTAAFVKQVIENL